MKKDISDNAHLNIFVADIDVDCVFSHVHLTKWFWLMDMDIDMWIHEYMEIAANNIVSNINFSKEEIAKKFIGWT